MYYKGLTNEAAKEALKQYGFNEIADIMRVSIIKIFSRQIFSNFLVYILAAAVLLSFFAGKTLTAYTVGTTLVLVVGMGFIQEYRAEKAIKALKTMIVSTSIVLRAGKQLEVPTKELVPGDIVLLRTGEKVPADCVVRESKNLSVNESILTGESKEINKKEIKKNELAEDINKVFMGTLIVKGKATVEVIHTGMNTRFGKIAGLISTAEKQLPLRKKINNIVKVMVIVSITVAILTSVVLFLRADAITPDFYVNLMIISIAIAVATFPEGFPVVLTTTLALGAKRMAIRNAIVNRMSIIETLGETTVICSDKTGTITRGEMTVKEIITGTQEITVTGVGYEIHGELLSKGKKVVVEPNSDLNQLINSSILCNDTFIERTGDDNIVEVHGTPTEGALLVMAAKAGFYKEDYSGERIEEVPFTSEKKFMSILYKDKEKSIAYQNGAPDIIINKCKFIQKDGEISEFSKEMKQHFLEKQAALAKKGYRVLCFSYAPTKVLPPDGELSGLIFLGLVGMEDPPREEILSSIKACTAAGIKVKMITGDYKETAIAIAKQVGISGKVLLGAEIDDLSDEELSDVVQGISIFARVRPEHKLRIVRALKNKGEVVTMTGDGVNDAPALKEAHIGVAMGKNGTDVSRESADLTLKDDNFSTIVAAIEEGRTIYGNIRKFISYQLSCTIAEIIIIFFGLLIGLPLPLMAMQILLMNVVTSDLPAITLGMNPTSKDAMQLKPRKSTSLFNKDIAIFTITSALIMGAITLLTFWTSLTIFGNDLDTSRTIAFVLLILFEIANAFNFRSFRFGVHELPLRTNKLLVYASIASIIITLTVVYTPLNKAFEGTVPITLSTWIICGGISLSVIFVHDLIKRIIRTKQDAKLLAKASITQ